MRALADLLFPRSCVVCGRPLRRLEEDICIWCGADLPLTWYWLREENPMADRLNALLQKRIDSGGAAREDYCRAVALFYYNRHSGYGAITRSLKYHANLRGGRHFAKLLAEKMLAAGHEVDAVIPVPLHWARRRSRGYNQAEIIGREMARVLGASLWRRVIRRVRRTGTQTRVASSAREENVAGAFRASGKRLRKLLEAVPGRPVRVMLVDDVCTTGATLAACHAALRDALSAIGAAPSDCLISFASLGFVGA